MNDLSIKATAITDNATQTPQGRNNTPALAGLAAAQCLDRYFHGEAGGGRREDPPATLDASGHPLHLLRTSSGAADFLAVVVEHASH